MNRAIEAGQGVILLFILDQKLSRYWGRSEKRQGFYFSSLVNLERNIASRGASLLIHKGDPAQVIREVLTDFNIETVFLNKEVTPYGLARDKEIERTCGDFGVHLELCPDDHLTVPGLVTKDDGSPYTVFTPYYKKALKFKVPTPVQSSLETLVKISVAQAKEFPEISRWCSVEVPGYGLDFSDSEKILSRLKSMKNYMKSRDIPSEDGTTRLSAFLRFGVLSARQVFHYFDDEDAEFAELIRRQLYWRDFYKQIALNFPHVYKKSFRTQYDSISWTNDSKLYKLWKLGQTGFPIVDAGMRELNQTGFMHNRVRMITASFLVKNLHVDWREGAKYFAEKLIDYDPAVNNGNWQWAASTGCDAQPYFRIFNPWRQQKKFDPDCIYIKIWVPELADFSAKEIHAMEATEGKYLRKIINLRETAEETKLMFKQAAQN